MKFFSLIVLSAFFTLAPIARAQAPAPAGAARAQVVGTVETVDSAARQITVKTDKGETVTVVTNERSFVRRMPPGENDTKKAVPIALSDVAAGDRAVAIGQNSADQKSFEARTIYVMTRADVAQVHEKQQEDWQKRGSAGIVTALDPAAQTIIIKVGQRQTTVQANDKTEFLRYALDSAKLSDAKPSTFAQIKIGDELHVLGNHSADATSVAAEKVVSGSFKQIAGTIETMDPQTGSLKVKDLATKKSIYVRVNPDSTLKKLPDQLAAMLARRYQSAGGQGGPGEGFAGRRGDPAQSGGAPGSAGPGASGRGGFGGRGFGMPGGGRGDLRTMLDRLPALPLEELKPGDPIMISTTEGTDATHLTVIMLLAGVEPLLRASPNSTRDIMAGWNLGGGGGGEGN